MYRAGAIILLCAMTLVAKAQKFSNRGRDFWTGYGLHYLMELGQDNSQEMVLYFSAEAAANVKVTIQGNLSSSVQTYFVPANSVISTAPMPKSGPTDVRLYDLPPAYGGLGTSRVFQRSIHIESDEPIVAYAHISGAGSSGATMLMPVESWGYTYLSVNSQQALRVAGTGDGAFSWMFIVADHNNTVVEITPSVPLRSGAVQGVPFTVTLNRGDIYQVVGAAISATNGYDLTGTRVKSVGNAAGECFPVGVFAGSSSTLISCDGSNNGFADNLIQQIFPIQAWGKTYLTAPFSTSGDAKIVNPSIFRIAVKDPTTVVKKNGTTLLPSTLINNTYYQYISTTADYIEADKPILVTQYIPSMSDGANNSCNYQGLGDPEMVYLSPIEQSINSVGFYRNTVTDISVNYLTLIIPTLGLNSLTIDGSKTFSNVYPHPNKPGYSVVVNRWTAAQSQCLVRSDSSFTAVTYGLGRYDSYAYNAGTYINNLNGTLNLHNSEAPSGAVNPYTCRNTPVELSVLMAYQPTQLVWHVSQLTYMTPNTDITQTNPVSSGTVAVNGVTYYKYTLPGTYTFSQAGTFRFTVNSSHPSVETCNNTEALLLDVVVKDMGPIAAFTDVHSGCTPDDVTFSWNPAFTGAFTINRWQWTFPDGTTPTNKSEKKTFTVAGQYDVALKVISSEGCVADSIRKIQIDAPAVMSITATPTAVCPNAPVDFLATATGASAGNISKWYWDFGNGKTSTIKDPQHVTYATGGTYTVKLVGNTPSGCVTDTATQSVLVYQSPTPSFTVTPDVCLGLDVTITDQSQPAAGTSLTQWSWTLGDNTSFTNINNNAFTKNYAAAGAYTIGLVVTDSRGCTSTSFTKVATVHPLPQAAFTPPAVICMPRGSAAFKNGSTVPDGSALQYEWNFGDNSALATNRDPVHNYVTAGAYTVSLKATSSFGCSNSTSIPVANFAQQPIAAFNVGPSSICQNTDVLFTDQSQAVTGSLQSWQWNFGDGSTASKQKPSKKYSNAGSYLVSLAVTNTAGCTSDTVTKPVDVHIQPVVDAGPSFNVAEGTVVTFNPTVNSQNLVFSWSPAGELSNASALRPSYSAMHDQTFTLTATDGTSNCSASDELTVKILRPVKVPNAFSPNGDGINDTWVITNLIEYQGNTVTVFNRYGQQVFYSAGYGTPWDGRQHGNQLPVGVYYYVIDLKNGFGTITGSITLLR